MQCPSLTGRRVPTCMANDSLYIPSISELEQYCESDKYRECPHISANTAKGVSRPENEQRPL
jgi:hypothetical protein